MTGKRRVVVCGAGFAGINVAKRLENDCDVSLVAPTDRFVYLPLIHEVLSENVTPSTVTKMLDDILPRTKLVHGRAERVEENELITAAGDRIPFDDLVVAVGAEPNDFGCPGVSEHALSFYSVGDALRANAMLKMKAAEITDRSLRVVVAGASFTGVEVAGEVAELLDKLDIPREIVLLDALPEIFPRQSAEFQDGVYKGLERLGLEVRTGQMIVEVRADEVRVKGDEDVIRVPADVIFWCAGVKPRRIEGVNPNVRDTMRSVARDHVYLVGDAADFPREAGVPKLAQTAEAQAPIVAHNILNPDRMKKYSPSVKGLILSIGNDYAVAEIGPQVWTGRIPLHVKRTLYKAKIALA